MDVRLLYFICVLGLAGCANDPLIFVSATTYGLKISASPKQDEPIKFVIGYDQVDATLIPTTMDKDRERILSINNQCDPGDKSSACPSIVSATDVEVPAQTVQQIKQASDALNQAEIEDAGETKSLFGAKESLGQLSQTLQEAIQGSDASSIMLDSSQQATVRDAAKVLSEVETEDTELKQTTETAAEPLKQVNAEIQKAVRARSQSDSLSVFSSFNAKADASASTNVTISAQLGKVFATGIAAQHVAEGVGDSLRNAGPVACMQQLERTATTKPTVDEIAKICLPTK